MVMEELWDFLSEAVEVAALVYGMGSIVNCFFGYRIYKFMTVLSGVVIGAVACGALGFVLSGLEETGALLGILIGGVAGGLISWYFHMLGVFINGTITGFLISLVLMAIMEMQNSGIGAIEPGVSLLCGLALGTLSCIFYKNVMIVLTAIQGGVGIGFMVWIITFSYARALLVAPIAAILGMLVQFRMEKAGKKNAAVTKAEEKSDRCVGSEHRTEPLHDEERERQEEERREAEKLEAERREAERREAERQKAENLEAERRKKMEEKKRKLRENMSKAANSGKQIGKKLAETGQKLGIKILRFIRKHGKILGVIAAVLFAMIAAVTIITHNASCRRFYFNKRAELTGEYGEKGDFYRKALQEQENPESYVGLVTIALETGNMAEAGDMLRWGLESFPDEKELLEIKEDLTPAVPVISMSPGTYEEPFEVELLPAEGEEYPDKIYYSVNGGDFRQYGEPIAFMENGMFTLTAYAKNDALFASDTAVAEYELRVALPEEVTISLEGGRYEEPQMLTLSNGDGYKIYYTTDGTAPTQESLVYENEIKISYGVTTVCAVAFNEYGMPGNIVSAEYRIAGEEHFMGKGCNGCRYDYLVNSNILVMDKQTGETVYTISDGAPYYQAAEYEDTVYAINKDHNIVTIDPETWEITKLGDLCAGKFVFAHGCIYFSAYQGARLYRVNMDGSDLTSVIEGTNFTGGMMVNNDVLYLYDGNGYLAIPYQGAQPVRMAEVSGTVNFFVADDGAIYYALNGSIYQYRNGQTEIVKEREYSKDEVEPRFLTNGSVSVMDLYYTIAGAMGKKLYLVSYNESYVASINFLSQMEGERNYYGNDCIICYDMETGKLENIGIGNRIVTTDRADYIATGNGIWNRMETVR